MNIHLTLKSANKKTGPIPVSTSTAKSCPPSCPFSHGGGCYATGGPLAIHWRKVTNGERGMCWKEFCDKIEELPEKQLWRHNQAGDLMGVGERINATALRALVKANTNKQGYTYTHKFIKLENHELIKYANDNGFAINLSGNSISQVDELKRLNIGPVTCVLPHDSNRRTITTKEGNKIIQCPATYKDDVTCASCKLCALCKRDVVIGFPAHGSSGRKASTVANQSEL
jgi:hypothetical protein